MVELATLALSLELTGVPARVVVEAPVWDTLRASIACDLLGLNSVAGVTLASVTDEATGVVTAYTAGVGINLPPADLACPGASNASVTTRRLGSAGTNGTVNGTVMNLAVVGSLAAIAAFVQPTGADVTAAFNASIALLSAAGNVDPATIHVNVRSASSSTVTASPSSSSPPSPLALGLGLGIGVGLVAIVAAVVWGSSRHGTLRGGPKSPQPVVTVVEEPPSGHAHAATNNAAPATVGNPDTGKQALSGPPAHTSSV